MELYLNYWHSERYTDLTQPQTAFTDEFRRTILTIFPDVFGAAFTDAQLRGFPSISPEDWSSRVDALLELFLRLARVEPRPAATMHAPDSLPPLA